MHLSILRFLAIWLFINYFSNYCNFQENILNTHLSVYFIALYLHVSVDFISNIHINSKVCFSTLAALTPKLRVLFISIFWSVLLRDLLIYHSIACIIALHLLASVDFRMFSQNEFVSPLQQLLHTPKLSFIPIYILKSFTEGFVHSLGFITALHLFASEDFRPFFSKMSLYLHFSSIYILQNLQFYSYLYFQGFYWGVCSYISHTYLYNILFLKTKCICICFLSIVSIFWFILW